MNRNVSCCHAHGWSPDDQHDHPPRRRPLGQPPRRPARSAGWPDLTFRHRGRTVLAWVAALVLASCLSTPSAASSRPTTPRPGSDSSEAAADLLEDGSPPSRATRSTSSSTPTAAVDAAAVRPTSRPCSPSWPTCRTSPRSTTRTRRPAASPPTAAPSSRTPQLDVVNPRRHAGRGQRADARRSPTPRPRTASRSPSAGRRSSRPSRATSAPRASASPPPRSSCCSPSAPSWPPGCRSSWPSPAWPSAALLTGLLIAFIDAPDWSTSLATMMGIGIGIDYALLMVTRFREWRAAGLDARGRHGRHPRHRRPRGDGRRQHRRHQHAGPVRDGPVVHARRGPRHDPRRPRRDGRQHHAVPRPARLPRQAHRPAAAAARPRRARSRSPSAATSSRARGVAAAGAGWSSGTGCVAALVGVAILLALASPFLGVRFGFPDAGNNREGTSTRTAYDTARRRLRPGRERAAAAGRRAAAVR